MTLLFQLPRIKKRFARFLEAQADKRFLVRGNADRSTPRVDTVAKATVGQGLVG
jgi:hypothetical protein